jgi:hypothetical protein
MNVPPGPPPRHDGEVVCLSPHVECFRATLGRPARSLELESQGFFGISRQPGLVGVNLNGKGIVGEAKVYV